MRYPCAIAILFVAAFALLAIVTAIGAKFG